MLITSYTFTTYNDYNQVQIYNYKLHPMIISNLLRKGEHFAIPIQIDYSFRYYIDELDGVSLDHWERKQFDGSVSGGYGYLDPNGVARTVHYKVEDDKGFEAIIKVVSPGGLFYFQQQHQLPLRQPTVPIQHAKPINVL